MQPYNTEASTWPVIMGSGRPPAQWLDPEECGHAFRDEAIAPAFAPSQGRTRGPGG